MHFEDVEIGLCSVFFGGFLLGLLLTMRCIVSNCKNDSKHTSKLQGTTFHVFPNEPTLCLAWLKALGKEHWTPKERSAICSDHFLSEDLYWTKNGLRKVKTGAIPIIFLNSNSCEFEQSTSLKVCRICLATDNKLFSIRKYKLEQAYQNVTGLEIGDEDNLPENVCVECAHRLYNCNKFRRKSIRAHWLMLEIIKKQDRLSLQSIKAINRESNQLTSCLSIKHYDTNYVDFNLEHDEKANDITDNTLEVSREKSSGDYSVDVEVKHETPNNEIFFNENDSFGTDEVKDEDSINDIIPAQDSNNGNGETDANIDFDNDENFLPSDANYSTDDSLPLEKHRSLKKRKRKIEKSKGTKKVRKKLDKNEQKTTPKIDRRRRPFLNADLNETLFSITELSVEEQLAEIQKRQETANYKNSAFKCTACYKGFLDEEAYNSHMLRHTNQCGDHKCVICKTHFKHPHALRKHITAHHTQRFSCNQCPYVTTHRQTARLHERWHKGTKYKCPHCPDEFVKFTTYMGHIRIKHPSDFVCELCGYSFVSEKGIDLHKKLKHRVGNVQIPEDGPYCEVCAVRFVSVEAHRKHLSVSARHSTDVDRKPREPNKSKTKKTKKSREPKEYRENKERDSDECDKKLYPSQIRKAEGPIPCEQCGLQLEDSRAYHGHFRRMHPDKNRTNYPSMKSPCMCEVCGKMFQSYALLRDHTWLHTGERPFKCDSCGKAFRMKQRLVAHRRVHSQVKATYVCSVCGKHFSTHSNRQRHMFIHTGLKPFKCEMCGKGFKHSSEKRAHIEYVHLKKPWPKRARGKRRPERPPPQASGPATSANEMDIVQPLWSACDPKLTDMNVIMDDKPMYYNMKI